MKLKAANPRHVQFSRRLNEVPVGNHIADVDELWDEIQGYIDVLLGRKESPVSSPYLAMAEVATAYYSRGQELDALIHAGEREGVIIRGSSLYKFRTGELRSFLELAKRCAELGSRRLTQERLIADLRETDL